jgi:chromatin assembly factor 1 subunit A
LSDSTLQPDAKAATQSSTTSTSNVAAPPPKRKRLTAAEKEARDKEIADKKKEREKEIAEKKKEREEKAAAKAAETAKVEAEKAARAKEREEKRKQKEEEDRIKNQEREEKRKKKEEEQRLAQEAKDKAARQQPKLQSFFGAPKSPKKDGPTTAGKKESPQKRGSCDADTKARKSEYQKLFQPFFLRDNTRLASSATQMDEETKAAKSAILDEYVSGKRQLDRNDATFDVVEALALPSVPRERGRLHHPVKHIMEAVYKDSEMAEGNTDEANKILKEARQKLSRVPMKVIAFSQDVRPPYYGTVTFQPFVLGKSHMRKLARRSMGRRLPLDYEYDSEAEWQEEEGEDVDMDDDEEDLDEEDDMEGFLDDSEDNLPSRRLFANTIEPESSGICFENSDRKGPNHTLYDNRMEIILGEYTDLTWLALTNMLADNHGQDVGLDPWSTSYWEPEPKNQAKEAAAKMPPPAAPANAFVALSGSSAPPSAKLVKPEIMDDVKLAILQNKGLSKVGIIEFVFQQFRDKASRTEVKNTIELVAEKKKMTNSKIKEWDLKPGHEITTQ